MTSPYQSPSRAVVAAEIRAAMGRTGIRQADLADRIGMSRTSLSERLNQRRAFTTDHLCDIADALGVDFISLFTPPPAPKRIPA